MQLYRLHYAAARQPLTVDRCHVLTLWIAMLENPIMEGPHDMVTTL